jgi:hypothetical protein
MSLPFDFNRNNRTSCMSGRCTESAITKPKSVAHAMDQLIDILAQAVAEELLRDAEVK